MASTACKRIGSLRQTGMFYGSLVLEWQCQSEACQHNNDHTELLVTSVTADTVAVMLKGDALRQVKCIIAFTVNRHLIARDLKLNYSKATTENATAFIVGYENEALNYSQGRNVQINK